LNGDDIFEIDPDVNSKIRIRMIGGKGNDTFDIKGKIKNYLYDITYEKNVLLATNNSKKKFSSDPTVNEFKTTGFNYNSYRFPEFNFGYNPEDKLMVGIGFSAKNYGFRKDPYSAYQKLTSLYALGHQAYQVKYQGIFNDVILHKDLLVNAEVVNPTLNNFFGFGNKTEVRKILGRPMHTCCVWPATPERLDLYEDFESAVDHTLRVEGHGLRVHRRDARVLHDFCIDPIAMCPGLEYDPREYHSFSSLALDHFGKRNAPLPVKIISHTFPVLEGPMLTPNLSCFLSDATVCLQALRRHRQDDRGADAYR